MVAVVVVVEEVVEVEEDVEVVLLLLLYSVACQDKSCGWRGASLAFSRRFTCSLTSARIQSFLGFRGRGTFCSSQSVPVRNIETRRGGVKAGVIA